jgi:DNA-binding transcriptional LysR family regulator
LTQVLSYQVGEALESGRLVSVLDSYSMNEWPVHLLHNEHNGHSAKVRAFLEIAVERLRANPHLQKPASSRAY